MLTRILKMMTLILVIIVINTAKADEYPIKFEKAEFNSHDVKSIQRGAKYFATYCLACHSLDLMSHDPIAKVAGITPNKMPDKNQKWWFGAAPPDLSLSAKVRGANWLYTYLHVFYKDSSRPIGTNNLLIDNVNMPNPFLGIQGEQILQVKKSDLVKDHNIFTQKPHYYTVLTLTRGGSISPDDFDLMINDLVNFLVYTSDPKKYSREKLGIWVLLFIAIFFIVVYLLKREYWKQIK